ncbi:MAG: hypothetical protein AAF787_10380 [Chloroflexota bacterium]
MTHEINAAFLTEAAILVIWAFAPFYFWVTFREGDHSLRKTILITVVIALWGVWGLGASKYRLDDFIMQGFPGRPFVYLLLSAAIVWIFRRQLVGNGLSQKLLVGLQVVRPVGMVFVLEHYRGNLPGIFAHPAGWGDLLVGIVAIAVLVRYRHQATIPDRAVILVFVLGIADFTSAFFFGFTSSESPLQLFAFQNPNPVLDYPTGLIPLYLVPVAVIFHILSLTEMQRARSHNWTVQRQSTGQQAAPSTG